MLMCCLTGLVIKNEPPELSCILFDPVCMFPFLDIRDPHTKENWKIVSNGLILDISEGLAVYTVPDVRTCLVYCIE